MQYATANGREVLDVFTCIREHTHLDAAGKLLTQNSERHLKSDAEMRALFRDLPEAIENTERLAERLAFSLENIGYEFPDFSVPAGHTMDSFLRTIVWFGAQQRYDAISSAVRRQTRRRAGLDPEARVFRLFPDRLGHRQFLPRTQHHGAGPGQRREQRGLLLPRHHAGGSGEQSSRLRTLSERKPQRLARYRSRSAERRSARERDPGNLPALRQTRRRHDRERDHLSRTKRRARDRQGAEFFAEHPRSLFASFRERRFSAHARSASANRAGRFAESASAHAGLRFACIDAIYGLPRHLGQHSGGMIICQGKLSSFVPLENASMPGRVVAQWDKDDCEDLGHRKSGSCSGSGMMSVMQDAFELCRERGRPLDLAHIPKDDPADVRNDAERRHDRRFSNRKPRANGDVAAHEAEMFLRCRDRSRDHSARADPGRHGASVSGATRRARRRSLILSIRTLLKPILERTLGVPLFQEQMLKIAMVMADFSGDEAEELRRALSFHRSQERMEKVSVKLRAAMERKNVAPEVIEKIMQSITSFALYGFPGIARHQFRDSGLWQRLSESASRAGVLREPAEQSADGFLFAGHDRERCEPAWSKDAAGLCQAIGLALHGCFG